jgi:hypothetical protein
LPPASLHSLGLIMGGIIGGTVVAAFYRLPRLILVTVRSDGALAGRIEKPEAV